MAVTIQCVTFSTSRAREGFSIEGSGTADTARLLLEGLSAFGGGREDCKIGTGRYPTTRLPIGVKILAPDLRDSVPAHGKLSQSARHLSRTDEGGWWGACPKKQCSLVVARV